MKSRSASLAAAFAFSAAFGLTCLSPTEAEAQTWTAQTTNLTGNVAAIHFATENIGYAAVGNSILKTTNGGAIWTNIYPDEWTYQAFYFLNKDTGWAVGNGGDIRKTTNGGTAWTNQTNNGGGTNQLIRVVFTNPLRGFAIRSSLSNGKNIIRTTNGGTTWEPDTIGTGLFITDIQFMTPAIGVAVGGRFVFKTADSGNTWTATTTFPFGTALYASKFLNVNTGYIAGTYATLYGNIGEIHKTTNGGTTWTKVLTGEYNDIGNISWNDLDCVDADRCLISGNGGAFLAGGFAYLTRNGGVTWEKTYSKNPGIFNAVSFHSATGAYLVGNTGLIMRSDAVTAVAPAVLSNRNGSLTLSRAAGAWTAHFNLIRGGAVHLTLYDLAGKPLWTSTLRGAAGENSVTVPTYEKQTGIRILELRTDEGRQVGMLAVRTGM